MNNLTQRIITATILIVVLSFLLFKSSVTIFTASIYVCGLLAVWELWRLIQPHNKTLLYVMGGVYTWVAFQLWISNWTDVLWVIGLGHIVVTLSTLYYQPKLQTVWVAVYGTVLLSVVIYSMLILYTLNPQILLSAMCLVWLADIGGYFVGKSIGKKIFNIKFAPQISPKKSWEGAIGGALIAAASILFALSCSLDTWLMRSANTHLLSHLISLDWSWKVIIALLPLILAAYSVTGDLLESLLKRQAGVKDSSQLLPGHGGILDRIDALIPVLPLCAAWVVFSDTLLIAA